MPSENPSSSRSLSPDRAAIGCEAATAFNLDGPSRKLDTRVNAYRSDIADVALAGTLFAPHYAAPLLQSATGSAMMRGMPSASAEAVSQLLPGEAFAVLDITGDWAWGYSLHDHYVGYVERTALADPIAATHRIVAREAIVFGQASIKAAAVGTLPFGARVAGRDDGKFLAVAGGYIHLRHVVPLDAALETDPVSVAERFIGAPYLWGGRGDGGIDCSGLVQVALAATGLSAPRDSDQQRMGTGTALPEEARLRRGDIIHFPGHVGLMASETDLIHANAYWMSVVIEPLADVVSRLLPDHDRPILSRRRISA